MTCRFLPLTEREPIVSSLSLSPRATSWSEYRHSRSLATIFAGQLKSQSLVIIWFLSIIIFRRKNESINQKNLFHLLTEKLLLNCRSISLATYNALYEILIEQICPEILFVKHEDSPIDSTRFENHQLLKASSFVPKTFILVPFRLLHNFFAKARNALNWSGWSACFCKTSLGCASHRVRTEEPFSSWVCGRCTFSLLSFLTWFNLGMANFFGLFISWKWTATRSHGAGLRSLFHSFISCNQTGIWWMESLGKPKQCLFISVHLI